MIGKALDMLGISPEQMKNAANEINEALVQNAANTAAIGARLEGIDNAVVEVFAALERFERSITRIRELVDMLIATQRNEGGGGLGAPPPPLPSP